MRYIFIGLLAVLFLAPSAGAWKYGQGTCEDDIHCDSHRKMQQDIQEGYRQMREETRRNWEVYEMRRANRIREAERQERLYQDTLDSLSPDCWPWCD